MKMWGVDTEPKVSNTLSRLILAKVMDAMLLRPHSSEKALIVLIGSDEIIKTEVFEKEEIDFFISVTSYWQCSQVVLNSMTTVGAFGNSYVELSMVTIGSDLSKAIFSFALSTARNFATVLFSIHAANKVNEILNAQSKMFLMLRT